MLLEYRKVYLVHLAPDQGLRTMAIAPRMNRAGEPMLQYLTDSDAPGSNAHSVLHPSFSREDDGSVSVVNTETDDEWIFTEMTHESWRRFIAPKLDPQTIRNVEAARTNGIDIQQYYLDQQLDEEEWPETV